ncbi:MAG: type I-E CRISPR-associated endonuclease Cas1e [Sphaerochaetaceae bacterium]
MIISPVSHDIGVYIKEKYPSLYLEHGRLEIDDSSVKWIDSSGSVTRIPVATIGTLLLGPGTSVTHEAIKVCGTVNCTICWIGEDSLHYYATGKSPTADTRNLRSQAMLSCNPEKSLIVARRMYADRFPDENLSGFTLNDMMMLEGRRQQRLYATCAQKYNVGWQGRSYVPGKFELSSITNKIISAENNFMYAMTLSSIISLGYSPYLGFIHSGSPLPFVYDISDLYKAELVVEPAFELTRKMMGEYNATLMRDSFLKKVIEFKLFEKISKDIKALLKDVS